MEKKEKCLYFEDNPFKISHKKGYLLKRYIDHLKEIEEIGNYLLEFYELKEYEPLFKDLKGYHDTGKLLNEWDIDGDKKPPHAIFSALYYNRIVKKNEKIEKNNYITTFFIYRHHSPLYFPDPDNVKIPKFEKIRVVDREFSYEKIKKEFVKWLLNKTKNIIIDYLDKLDFKEIINLVDTFGIFKLSDNISGSFKHIDLEKAFSKIEIDSKRLTNLYFFAKEKRKNKNRLVEQIRIVKNSGNPSIIILPTGYGKTLIHLLFISKWKPSRVFYILPTITSIKKFYEELKMIFKDVGRKYFFVDVEEEYDDILEGNFLKKINIITIDQFLRTFLQLGKYYARRFLFRNSLIIIDEFHLLNENMLELSLYFLKKYFDIYNLKIVFSSATLNKEFLFEIANKFSPIWINGVKIEGKNFEKVKNDILKRYSTKPRFKLKVVTKDIMEDIEKIEEFSKNKKVLVIVNTVNKAIQIYRNLNVKRKILLHGRFAYIDRDLKEKRLYELLTANKPFAFVSTQVCEVSLDVDFDILFTEASSIPSLIQRFGRVNRGGKKKDSIVFLYKPKDLDVQKFVYKNVEETFHFFEKNKDKTEREWMERYFDEQILDCKKIEDIKKMVINCFESSTMYFFSFSKKEDEESFWKLVNFREAYSTFVLLDPEIIDEKTLKFWQVLTGKDYKKLYNKYYNDGKGSVGKFLKRFLVSVNVRNKKLYRVIYEQEYDYENSSKKHKGYPRLPKEVKDELGLNYNHKYGLYVEKEDYIL